MSLGEYRDRVPRAEARRVDVTGSCSRPQPLLLTISDFTMSVTRGAKKLHLRACGVSNSLPVASTSKSAICQRVATARQFSSRPEDRGSRFVYLTPNCIYHVANSCMYSRNTDAGSDLLSLLDRARCVTYSLMYFRS